MKYIKQFMIIMLFSFLGEVLNYILPFSIPASIYGMILLFIALVTNVIKLEQIEETAEFLLSIMLIFFVPASVGIMDNFSTYRSSMFSITLIVLISTIVVLVSTGITSNLVIKLINKKEKK